MIQNLGNYLSEVESIYRQCKARGELRSADFLGLLDLHENEWLDGSYFITPEDNRSPASTWHTDYGSRKPLELIISAYPYPTEILVGYDDEWKGVLIIQK